jgi:uncharacterized membrane protein YGL010W
MASGIESKLMDMLVGYASAHQHPMNIAVHLVGIPTIMLGVFIALSWMSIEIVGVPVNMAILAVIALFLFYLTLDRLFAIVFLVFAIAVAIVAARLGSYPQPLAAIIAAAAFFGGYAAQFIGHAVEKSMPVLVKHPIQANLAAPFFTIVEIFKLLGLRDSLFAEVRARVVELRNSQA